jgi:predicted dehydrogenase
MPRAEGTSHHSSDETGTLNVGLIGAGRIVERVYFDVLSSLPAVRVAAVADPSAERRQIARHRFPVAALVEDLDAVLANTTIAAIIVCSPPAHHAQAALRTLAAGRHLYLEKPVGTALDEARQVLAAWRDRQAVAMIGFNYRFHPLVLALKREIAAGRLGQPVAVRTAFSVSHRAAGWQNARATGGGALLELGSHHFDLTRFLLDDDVAEVASVVSPRAGEADTALCTLRFSRGAHAQCFFAVGAADDDRIDVIGDAGGARFDRLRGTLEFTCAAFEYGRPAALRRELTSLRAGARRLAAPMGEPSYRLALSAFVRSVRNGERPRPDLLDGYRSLEIVVAAERAAAEGQTVRLSTSSS